MGRWGDCLLFQGIVHKIILTMVMIIILVLVFMMKLMAEDYHDDICTFSRRSRGTPWRICTNITGKRKPPWGRFERNLVRFPMSCNLNISGIQHQMRKELWQRKLASLWHRWSINIASTLIFCENWLFDAKSTLFTESCWSSGVKLVQEQTTKGQDTRVQKVTAWMW